MSFTDTHCHIHSKIYKLDASTELEDALKQGVEKVILVAEDVDDSKLAKAAAAKYNQFWTAGIHPHEASKHTGRLNELKEIVEQAGQGFVGVGECGLDYYYQQSERQVQKSLLRFQLELAGQHNLPLSLHIRGSKDNPSDAFDDFFELFKDFRGQRGVVHSFTSGQEDFNRVLSFGLLVGFNGIITFTGSDDLREMAANAPKGSFVLETDAPFLTPAPKRGRINSPSYIPYIARYLAEVRGESIEEISAATQKAAEELFGLK